MMLKRCRSNAYLSQSNLAPNNLVKKVARNIAVIVTTVLLTTGCVNQNNTETQAASDTKEAIKKQADSKANKSNSTPTATMNSIESGKVKAKKKKNEMCEQAHFRWMEARASEDEAAIAAAKRSVDKYCAKGQ